MPNKNLKKLNFLDNQYNLNVQKLLKNSDSYKNLIYGIVTVIVLFIVIVLGVRSLSKNKAEIDNEAAMTEEQSTQVVTSSYTVLEGETLWSIAEKTYKDGFKWTEIAKANKIDNPTMLMAGSKIIIPSISSTEAETAFKEDIEPAKEEQTALPKISGSSYKVVKDDCLWNIAVRAYGDGLRWVDIAKTNKLANPDLIHAGNVFKLPRP